MPTPIASVPVAMTKEGERAEKSKEKRQKKSKNGARIR
jgi:hypothetical protein